MFAFPDIDVVAFVTVPSKSGRARLPDTRASFLKDNDLFFSAASGTRAASCFNAVDAATDVDRCGVDVATGGIEPTIGGSDAFAPFLKGSEPLFLAAGDTTVAGCFNAADAGADVNRCGVDVAAGGVEHTIGGSETRALGDVPTTCGCPSAEADGSPSLLCDARDADVTVLVGFGCDAALPVGALPCTLEMRACAVVCGAA